MPESFQRLAIQLHARDNVAIAKQDIAPQTILTMPDNRALTLSEKIPAGHKFALRAIALGEAVSRYGHSIGIASQPIAPGAWVHSHNLQVGEISKAYSYQVVAARPLQSAPQTFLGYARADGRVGTRNYIAVISSVNCSAHVTTNIARAFTRERLSAFPNVDGVIPITHQTGCGIPLGDSAYDVLQRALANVAINPNIGAYVLVGLGCEINQADACCQRIASPARTHINIQVEGGYHKTVAAGIAIVERLLPQVNAVARTPQPISELTLALQCGGSDGWSGITANPLVGLVADRIVAQGGTAVLSETPEIFGAEDLLLRRVVSSQVGAQLIARFDWWNTQAKLLGFSVDNNPGPGNKAGGLTTIFEKSLGAAAKGGSSPLTAVYEYGERVTQRGLVFMDTPGYDPVSVTGQLAGGCNLIVFTTGRGSIFQSNVAPCVKVASNAALYARMRDDMDFDASVVLNDTPMERAADQLFEYVIATASGQRTRGEQHGLPENEFVPWHLGAVL
ncbi:MAG: altronate dehydratase [Chloroflexi bacterium]|nr:altronate dehydratase [Chloroflexota bacterium]